MSPQTVERLLKIVEDERNVFDTRAVVAQSGGPLCGIEHLDELDPHALAGKEESP